MLPMCPVWTDLKVARPRGFEPLTAWFVERIKTLK